MNDTIINFSETVFGTHVPFKLFAIYLLFAFTGLLFSLVLELYKSDVKSKEFKFKYWWSHNKFRVILNIIAMTLGILFTEDLLGIKLSVYNSFLAGFTSDKIIETLKRKLKRTEDA